MLAEDDDDDDVEVDNVGVGVGLDDDDVVVVVAVVVVVVVVVASSIGRLVCGVGCVSVGVLSICIANGCGALFANLVVVDGVGDGV